MELEAFDNCYTTGIPLIDRQHRGIFELINRIEALCKQHQKDVAASLLDGLGELLRIHMETEERLMSVIGFPYLVRHHEVHGLVLVDFEKMCKKFSGLTGEDLTHFFDSVMRHHLDELDRQYIVPYKAWLCAGNDPQEWL